MNYRCKICQRGIDKPPYCDNSMCLDQARRDAMKDNPRPSPWLPTPKKWEPPKVDEADIVCSAPDTIREIQAARPVDETSFFDQIVEILHEQSEAGMFVDPESVLMLTTYIRDRLYELES